MIPIIIVFFVLVFLLYYFFDVLIFTVFDKLEQEQNFLHNPLEIPIPMDYSYPTK